uniref:Uncharacterized protein n=1 Tax=Eutreptiella gymnastica TaxID=73025 RepID=A0A7S1HYM5_9EUGL|mmetsp:Transcript_115041/g.200188  ORF Transcript_115041/g.200188 Transcript_115041/m.200188 type:complete len:101 (+) Transcript_115041:687-989(+)
MVEKFGGLYHQYTHTPPLKERGGHKTMLYASVPPSPQFMLHHEMWIFWVSSVVRVFEFIHTPWGVPFFLSYVLQCQCGGLSSRLVLFWICRYSFDGASPS